VKIPGVMPGYSIAGSAHGLWIWFLYYLRKFSKIKLPLYENQRFVYHFTFYSLLLQ